MQVQILHFSTIELRGIYKIKPDIQRKLKVPDKHTQSSISIATRERALLMYMLNLNKERFNVKKYSRISNIPRATVYELLNRLISKGLAAKPYIGNHEITLKGKTAIEVSSGGVENLRMECREKSVNLSTHYLKYSLIITEKDKYFEEKLMELNPLKIKRLELRNLKQTYLYFDDATIIINPKKVIVRVHDIVSEGAEDANLDTFNKALGYIEKLEKIGLKGDTMELEPAHYARIDSLLAGFLEKVDGRYFLDLGEGKKFWIDHSAPNKIEDYTCHSRRTSTIMFF